MLRHREGVESVPQRLGNANLGPDVAIRKNGMRVWIEDEGKMRFRIGKGDLAGFVLGWLRSQSVAEGGKEREGEREKEQKGSGHGGMGSGITY